MSKANKELLQTFLFIVFFGIVWLAADLYEMSKVWLPDDVKNLKTFAEKMPSPKDVHTFEKGDSRYIEVIGHRPGFPANPSGNPIYIFDDKGKVIYWTGDAGDSNHWEKWGQYRLNIKKVSLQEALDSVDKNN